MRFFVDAHALIWSQDSPELSSKWSCSGNGMVSQLENLQKTKDSRLYKSRVLSEIKNRTKIRKCPG